MKIIYVVCVDLIFFAWFNFGVGCEYSFLFAVVSCGNSQRSEAFAGASGRFTLLSPGTMLPLEAPAKGFCKRIYTPPEPETAHPDSWLKWAWGKYVFFSLCQLWEVHAHFNTGMAVVSISFIRGVCENAVSTTVILVGLTVFSALSVLA